MNDIANGGSHHNVLYTGTLTWYDDTTISDHNDEIVLHRSGKTPNNGNIYLRTIGTNNG